MHHFAIDQHADQASVDGAAGLHKLIPIHGSAAIFLQDGLHQMRQLARRRARRTSVAC